MILKNENLFIYLITILIIISFFVGFILGENSAGAGGLDGDFKNFIWPNLQLFNNGILSNLGSNEYSDSRTPLIYIIHVLFNPLANDEFTFRLSVFLISLLCPYFFFLNLKIKYEKTNKPLLLLISTLILLSPYFRTSAYWGLNENYGFLSFLISFFFYQKLIKKENNKSNNYYLLIITLSSSLSFYFDQKLLIFPLCFFVLILLNNSFNKQFKIITTLYFFLFSIPAFYMIYIWKSILPNNAMEARGFGQSISFLNLGYASSIIFFYIFPFLFFQRNIKENLFGFLKKHKYYFFIFCIYIFFVIFFDSFNNLNTTGKGIFYKLLNIFFLTNKIKLLATLSIFYLSWISINFYLEKKYLEKIFYYYFLLISLFVYPIFQEYFDPLVIILIFTIWKTELIINKKNIYFLTSYLSFFLISANLYYLLK